MRMKREGRSKRQQRKPFELLQWIMCPSFYAAVSPEHPSHIPSHTYPCLQNPPVYSHLQSPGNLCPIACIAYPGSSTGIAPDFHQNCYMHTALWGLTASSSEAVINHRRMSLARDDVLSLQSVSFSESHTVHAQSPSQNLSNCVTNLCTDLPWHPYNACLKRNCELACIHTCAVPIKCLHNPVQIPGFCDIIKWQKDK